LKTNQFNLTAERISSDDFRLLLNRKDAMVIGMRVADRFGDSGVTGLAIVTGVGSNTWTVENFLLSCRVIGRTVEHAFVSWLGARAEESGAKQMQFKFKASARNQVAKDFLDRSGLEWNDALQVWQSPKDTDEGKLAPHFVSIDDQEMLLKRT
jgi:FkbH-like protein